MKQTQLALLISDGITCKGVESIIKQSNFSSYGISEFGDTQSILQSSIQFDLVLLDVSTYKSIDIEHDLRLIQKRFAHVKIIVISSRLTIQHIRYIMQLGAKGFIYRDELTKSLLHSIDLVLRDVVTLSQQPLELLDKIQNKRSIDYYNKLLLHINIVFTVYDESNKFDLL